MPLSDPRAEMWRPLRVAVLSALLKRKGLVTSPGATAAAAAEDSLERAWKRLSVTATRAPRFRWQIWGKWWGRS
jgi:hypothetical protein